MLEMRQNSGIQSAKDTFGGKGGEKMSLFRYSWQDQEQMFLSMIRLDCRHQHGREDGLCPEHQQLADYVSTKVRSCPYARDRRICTIHDLYCFNRHNRKEMERIIKEHYCQACLLHPFLTLRLRLYPDKMNRKKGRKQY